MLNNATLLHKYGITSEEYQAMLLACDGRCTICGKLDDDTLAVDHDHTTGKVRGLLCHECNSGIGLLGDNRRQVYKAYKYLQKYEKLNPPAKTTIQK